MERIKLAPKPKDDTNIYARALDEKAIQESFVDQPEYGVNYNPSNDKRDMYRLGRKQELKRRFKYCESMNSAID